MTILLGRKAQDGPLIIYLSSKNKKKWCHVEETHRFLMLTAVDNNTFSFQRFYKTLTRSVESSELPWLLPAREDFSRRLLRDILHLDVALLARELDPLQMCRSRRMFRLRESAVLSQKLSASSASAYLSPSSRFASTMAWKSNISLGMHFYLLSFEGVFKIFLFDLIVFKF